MDTSVTIIGGGHQGLAMAAHLALYGNKCFLWNRTYENIKDIAETKKIYCKGAITGVAHVENASTNIEENLQHLIMVTTPSSAHKDIAKMLAPHIDDTYTIVLNPGRTFGILEFTKTLRECGCKSLPLIAETQTIVYTCRRAASNSVTIFALKENVLIATYDITRVKDVCSIIPECIRNYFVPAQSFVETSLGNVGMILHCAPVLMNVGWIESPKADFKYYYDGISLSIATLLERMDRERIMVAKGLGYSIETLSEWLSRVYATYGDNLYEKLQNNVFYKDIDAPLTIKHRYIEEDVPNGLVPTESVAGFCGIKTPVITLIIDLANAVMQKDYRVIGRKCQDFADLKEML